MRLDLANATVAVTGAARGIGLGVACAAAARGANVALIDTLEDEVKMAAAEIGPNAIGLVADVTDRTALTNAFTAIAERFDGVDVVVANAGIAPRAATLRYGADTDFDRVIAVNLTGVRNTARAALPHIIERRGHVMLTSSVYAFANGVGNVPYAAAKAGVEQMARALRVELAPYGVTAGVVYYGFVDTEMVRHGFDNDTIAEAVQALLPKALSKRITPSQAADHTVRGIERRAARVVSPARWQPYSVFRGVLNPVVDRMAARDPRLTEVVIALDARSKACQSGDQIEPGGP